jgi:uncharacterized protein
VRIALSLFVATLTVSGAADAASFDCSKATRAVDRMICADAELSQSDSSLALAYKSALAAAHSDQDRTTLRDSQRLWLAKRDARCLRMVPAAAAACLKHEYRARLAQLAPATASTKPRISAFDDTALNKAHPKERDALEFPQGAFSPNGDLFAFAVNQIVSGDMDQVWLYSLAEKKLVAATPSPVQDKSDITIEGFSWSGDTLYVNGTQGPHGDAQEPFVRAARMAGSREIKAMPPPQTLPGGVRDTTAAAGDELADQGDKRLEDEHFAVTSRNEGHGALTLTAHDKVSKRDFTIATGTWGLGDFVFDAPRSRVIYANGNGGIDIYSLASRKTVASLPLPINTLLDVTADGDTAAFTSIGPCDAASKPAATRRQMICFVALPK